MKEGGRQTKFSENFLPISRKEKVILKTDVARVAQAMRENGNSFQKKFILDYISLNVLS